MVGKNLIISGPILQAIQVMLDVKEIIVTLDDFKAFRIRSKHRQFTNLKRTFVQKSNKNEIFMARVKNSNCLNFCTQVDPIVTRKAVYFFSSNMFLFSRKTNFSLSPSRIDGSGHNRSKIEHFRSLRISNILRLGKSYQRVLFHRLFVFCKM